MNCYWKYNSVSTEIVAWGCLPNGFATNELDPSTPNQLQEVITQATDQSLTSETISHLGDGQKPYRDAANTWHWV